MPESAEPAVPVERIFTIPMSAVDQFHRQRDRHCKLRDGQAFYFYMKLDRVADREFVDRLWESHGEEFDNLVKSRMDYNN